ncbi:MAG: PadR family transcriptional regulator [Cloacibacillus sp.]
MKKCACRGSFLERFIQPSILLILRDEPLHGFSLLKKLYKSDIMDYSSLDPTGLYRMLKKMEEAGLLSSELEMENDTQGRRIYRITEDGEICLIFWKATLLDYMNKIKKLAESIPDTIRETDKQKQ